MGINRKQFKDEYQTEIEKGIIAAYQKLYPNNIIKVTYTRDSDVWKFEVSATGFPVIDSAMNSSKTTVFLYAYANEQAIQFSSIPEKEYDKQYNDYSYENHKWLLEQIEQVAVMYKLRGIEFSEIYVDSNSYGVRIAPEGYSKNIFDSHHQWVDGNLDVSPISITTAKNILNKVKRAAKAVENGER
jgi:hypothetical protein